jgi:hypothetical protein
MGYQFSQSSFDLITFEEREEMDDEELVVRELVEVSNDSS